MMIKMFHGRTSKGMTDLLGSLQVGSIRYDINCVIGIRSNGLHSHGFLLLFCSKKTCVVGCDGTREVPMTQQFFVSELLPNQGLCTVAHSQWFSGS